MFFHYRHALLTPNRFRPFFSRRGAFLSFSHLVERFRSSRSSFLKGASFPSYMVKDTFLHQRMAFFLCRRSCRTKFFFCRRVISFLVFLRASVAQNRVARELSRPFSGRFPKVLFSVPPPRTLFSKDAPHLQPGFLPNAGRQMVFTVNFFLLTSFPKEIPSSR